MGERAKERFERFARPDTTGAKGGYPVGLARQPVPLEVVAKAFHESGLGVRELARRLKVHHSAVGRVVRGWDAKHYAKNASGQIVRYEQRQVSMGYDRARRYLRAMGADLDLLESCDQPSPQPAAVTPKAPGP